MLIIHKKQNPPVKEGFYFGFLMFYFLTFSLGKEAIVFIRMDLKRAQFLIRVLDFVTHFSNMM